LGFTPSPKQAEVLDHSAQRLILNCARQWGKSTVIALKSLYVAVHAPNTTIVVLAGAEDQAGLLIDKVVDAAAALQLASKRVRGRTHSIELTNGSKVYAITHSARTALGHTADILVVDEAAVVKDEVIAAFLPALARRNGKIWMLSTPNGETGLFYNIWHDENLKHWHRVKATIDDVTYVSREFLDEYIKLAGPRLQQDFYCEFVPASGRIFTRSHIALLESANKPYTPMRS
jgi:hypothetical protein